ERAKRVLSTGPPHPRLRHQALLARRRRRSIAGRPQILGLRFSVGLRVPLVRPREQQSPDRPPAAQPAVGYGWIPAELPAAAVARGESLEIVMAGPVPAIYVLIALEKEKTWIPATSAGMTDHSFTPAASAIPSRSLRPSVRSTPP